MSVHRPLVRTLPADVLAAHLRLAAALPVRRHARATTDLAAINREKAQKAVMAAKLRGTARKGASPVLVRAKPAAARTSRAAPVAPNPFGFTRGDVIELTGGHAKGHAGTFDSVCNSRCVYVWVAGVRRCVKREFVRKVAP